jgi:hypothetical protein
MREVFISFASADRAIADRLVRSLEQRGLSCWIAHRDIHGGENYQAQIPAAVEACAVMLVLYSRNAARSLEIPKEMVLARNHKKRLVPLRIEDHKPEGAFLYEFVTSQYLDLFTDFDSVVDILCTQLDDHCSKAGEVAARTRQAAERRRRFSWMFRSALVAAACVCAAAAWKLAPALHAVGTQASTPAANNAVYVTPHTDATPTETLATAATPSSGVAIMAPTAQAPAAPPAAMLLPPPPNAARAIEAATRMPQPSAPPALSAWEQRASDFAANYYTMMGAPMVQSLAFLNGAVADPVRFYGKQVPRARLIEIQRSYEQRWPSRNLTVRPGSVSVNCAASMQICEVGGIVDYDLHSEARHASSSGAERFTLEISGNGRTLAAISSAPLEHRNGTGGADEAAAR